MARRRPLELLEKEKLAEINEELRFGGFSNTKWLELGLSLGLSLQTLEAIEANHRGNTSRCLMTTLDKWLSRADNVTGPLSWIRLADGLQEIGEISTAEKISKLSDPASGLFQRYSVRLSAVTISEESVDLLCTERLISNETRNQVESVSGLLLRSTLREIRNSIAKDHNKLRLLGDILLKSDEAKTLGQEILKECDTLFSDTFTDLSEPDSSVVPISSVEEVFVSKVYNCRFDEVRVKFGDLRYDIIQLVVENVPLADDLKNYLSRCFPEVKEALLSVDSVEEVMNIIDSRCNIINIVPIKAIVNKYNITGAIKIITEFDEAVNDFCSKIKVKFMLNKKLSLAVSSLTCERVEFVLEWEPDEHTLDDIRCLLEKAFEDLGKRIIVRTIHRGNSIIIICHAPHHMLAALLLEAQDNLAVLLKDFSLIRLTIGHYTVYDRRIRYKIMNECHAEEIKLADGEEQELKTLLDYKEGSISERDKQLDVIKKRKEYIERILQTPEYKLKMERVWLQMATNEIFKSKKSDIQYFRTSLLTKAETVMAGTGKEDALLEYKKEIELLQENISIISVQLLMSQKANIDKKDQCTQSPKAEAIYTARIDYHALYSDQISFSQEDQMDIIEKWDTFRWNGRSLVSGYEGDIPSSCVYSMLESLQLLEFVLSVEKVFLPILQKIRNDSSSNDEKASLFLETINDDPIMISALRQDKEHYDCKGITDGKVDWGNDSVSFTSPSLVQCNEGIRNINNNHNRIKLESSSTNSTVSLLSSTKLYAINLRSLDICSTPLTNDCIQYLCILLTNNETIQELSINDHSISDRGVIYICQALEHNSTLTSLYLYDNPLITSNSGQTLSHLLLSNSSLVELDLRYTSLSTESILLILQSLTDKNTRSLRLTLDKRHEETCIITYPNYHLIQNRVDWKWY